MKTLMLMVVAAMLFSSCSDNTIKSGRLETKEDSLAYAYGINTYFAMQQDNFELDARLMAKGMIDAKEGKNTMDETVARGFLVVYFQEREQSEMSEMYKDVKEEGALFLEENKSREGVQVTESGLQYEVITMGSGPKPTAENTVKVHYEGKLINGEIFDSSVQRGEPLDLSLSGVIPGWTEGLQLMPVGSKFKFYIPYSLGYGDAGAGGVIPPFATLIFDVELIVIVN